MDDTGNEKIRSHNDLDVWKKSRELVKIIYKVTMNYPKPELFGLISQLRRASVSVPTNIAEGFGRMHLKEIIHFLCYSQGSLSEIETLVILSQDLEFLDNESGMEILTRVRNIRIMLTRLIRSLEKKLN